MQFDFRDAQNQMNQERNVEFQQVPVGGHNMNGRVERKIRQIKESVEKTIHGERLSIIQWETMCSEIGNAINDLPIAINNVVADLENADIITPNHLRLGHNNQRSPVGPLQVTGRPGSIITSNKKIYDSWLNAWLITCVPKLMIQPKWFRSDTDIKVGDIVLFLKKEGELNNRYQYGKVTETKISRDGKIRSVSVTYRNYNENTDRVTGCAVRELVVIHGVDELYNLSELGKVATAVDVKYMLSRCDDFLQVGLAV